MVRDHWKTRIDVVAADKNIKRKKLWRGRGGGAGRGGEGVRRGGKDSFYSGIAKLFFFISTTNLLLLSLCVLVPQDLGWHNPGTIY